MPDTPEQAAVRNDLNRILGQKLKNELLVAAGPHPRTGSAQLKATINDSVGKLIDEVIKTAGPHPRTGKPTD